MKTTQILLAGALILLASCSKANRTGTVITFSAVSEGAPRTKTEYSGVDEDGNPVGASSQHERIDWVAEDAIRIWCAQATKVGDPEIHWADYVVLSQTASDNMHSRATIGPEDPNALTWGTGSHTFYAVYPAPEDESFQTGGNFTGTIPAAQTVTQKQGTQTWLPDMRYAYMLAKNTVSEGPVSLYFYPKFTAFTFSVGPGQNSSVSVSSFTLSSTSTPLAGNFGIGANDYDTPANYTFSSTANTITLTFSPALTVTSEVTFTVLCLPATLTDLSITFTGAQIGTRTLALSSAAGTPLTFNPCKKHRLYGIRFPKLEEAQFGEDILWDYTVVAEEDPIAWGADAAADYVDWDHNVPSNIPNAEKINWE